AVVVRIGPEESAAHAELLPGEAHLLNGQGDRLHRQHGDTEEAVWIGTAVVGEPAIVGSAHGRREPRIVDRAAEETDARIKERSVDAVQVHVRNSRVRVEAALPPLDVLHGDVIDRALPGADPAEGAEPLGASQTLA